MNSIIPSSSERITLFTCWVLSSFALAHCNRIDECADWANRAAALASYARQADDDALERLATRVRARAIRSAILLHSHVEQLKGPVRR
jgi:hypothetical protein